MKKYLTKENAMLLLLALLIGHNIYLQFQIERSIVAAENAVQEARQASNSAEDARRYAIDAASFSEDASNNAESAWYAAREAADKAYGNECWSCP